MTPSFPFMAKYDPPGTSEDTLDPLGPYQIADQLTVQLVPAGRTIWRPVNTGLTRTRSRREFDRTGANFARLSRAIQ